MGASDEESSVRLPVILRVDPIWPPHMRKKRQTKTFQDLLKRKKSLVTLLSKSPEPEVTASSFRNEDTLLTIMERVKRRENHQRNILKKIQNQALENLKADAKELENSESNFRTKENYCNLQTQKILQRFEKRSKMIIKEIEMMNKNTMKNKSTVVGMVSERSVTEKLERIDKDGIHLHKRSKVRIRDDKDEDLDVPQDREVHFDHNDTHENTVLSSPRSLGKGKKMSSSRATNNGSNQTRQRTKFMNLKGGNGFQENKKIKKLTKINGKGKANYERQTKTEEISSEDVEFSEIEIQKANENETTNEKKERMPQLSTEVREVKLHPNESSIQIKNENPDSKENVVSSPDATENTDKTETSSELPKIESAKSMDKKRWAVLDPRFTKLVNTLISSQDNTAMYFNDT